MKKFLTVIGVIIVTIIIIGVGIFGGWFNTWFTNKVDYVDQKIEDATSYETRKQVEDSCRAMVSSLSVCGRVCLPVCARQRRC